jgi:hypothetical protein
VSVTIENVENLYAYELELLYPNNILNGTGNFVEGDFLKSGGAFTLFGNVTFTDNYNATYGVAWVYCTRMYSVPGVNGSGTLFTVTFKSISTSAPQTISLSDVELSDPNSYPIPFTTANAEVSVVPEFPTAPILLLIMASASASVVIIFKKKANRPQNNLPR